MVRQTSRLVSEFSVVLGFRWCWFRPGLYCPQVRGCGRCEHYQEVRKELSATLDPRGKMSVEGGDRR